MPRHQIQPPEWIATAPILVSESVEIDAPPSAVWRHIADHESWPEWFTDLDRVELTGESVGVGAGRRVFVNRLAVDEEFTEWTENEHFAFAVTATKVPFLQTMAESVRLEPTAGGTQVTYRQGLEARSGFGWLLRAIWGRASRSLPANLGRLKQRVESGS